MRQLLFELYEDDIVTKAQVYERGELELGEFYERLRAFRPPALARQG